MTGEFLTRCLDDALDAHERAMKRPVLSISMGSEALRRITEWLSPRMPSPEERGAGITEYRGIPVKIDDTVPLGMFSIEHSRNTVYGRSAPDWKDYVK